MKPKSVLMFAACAFAAIGCLGISAHAADQLASPAGAQAPAPAASTSASPLDDFCFIKGAPPSDFPYTRVKEMKLGKSTYGQVREILDEFASSARAAGADAIINYSGSQRFGFWPWRMVRPVVKGTAIKWTGESKRDCKSAGGAPLSEVLLTNDVNPDGASASSPSAQR